MAEKFTPVPRPKLGEFRPIVAVPPPQPIARREILPPGGESQLFFRDTPRPKSVDQIPGPVQGLRRVKCAFGPDRHESLRAHGGRRAEDAATYVGPASGSRLSIATHEDFDGVGDALGGGGQVIPTGVGDNGVRVCLDRMGRPTVNVGATPGVCGVEPGRRPPLAAHGWQSVFSLTYEARSKSPRAPMLHGANLIAPIRIKEPGMR